MKQVYVSKLSSNKIQLVRRTQNTLSKFWKTASLVSGLTSTKLLRRLTLMSPSLTTSQRASAYFLMVVGYFNPKWTFKPWTFKQWIFKPYTFEPWTFNSWPSRVEPWRWKFWLGIFYPSNRRPFQPWNFLPQKSWLKSS